MSLPAPTTPFLTAAVFMSNIRTATVWMGSLLLHSVMKEHRLILVRDFSRVQTVKLNWLIGRGSTSNSAFLNRIMTAHREMVDTYAHFPRSNDYMAGTKDYVSRPPSPLTEDPGEGTTITLPRP